jgi:ectoine hydroxylase-related dioxygenase (phytanoyl-CoA dioxygenase family)
MPAGLAQSAATLSPVEQKAFYETHGYLVFPELLDAGEVDALRAALDEVLREARGLTETNEKFSITRGHDGRHHVRRIFNPIKHHKAFYDAAFHPRIVDAVENLIGPDIQIHHTKLNLKPPSSPEARFEWHQDYPFFPHTNYDLLAVLVHLDEATVENGCIRLIPGSHQLGPRLHRFARDGAFSSQLEDRTVVADESRVIHVPCPAGSVELHHCNMLHSSTANRGVAPRSALIVQYRAADNVALGGSMAHFGFGLTVRGANLYQARLLDGTRVALPGEIKDPLQRDG